MGKCSVEDCANPSRARGLCSKHYMRMRAHGTTDSERDLTTEERFWSRVDRGDDCWLWRAGLRGDGYGAFGLGRGKQVSAHRYSYELHNGQIPDGMVVMHSCDVPTCVNPDHLRLGTQADNQADSVRKGRRYPGSQNHQAKLTESEVMEIRYSARMSGVTQRALAKRYNVSPALISHIVASRSWRHI